MEKLTDFEKKQMKDYIITQGLSNEKQNSNWKRILVAAVAIVVIGVPIFGFSFPVLAGHIPIIGGLFAQMDRARWGANMSTIADYSTIVGQTHVSDGLTFTLVEQFFNGREIYLSYLVESEFALDQSVEWFSYDLTRDVTVTIDGELLPVVGSGGGMPYIFWIDEYRFFFMLYIPVVQGESPRMFEIVKNAEMIEVTTNFSDFGIGEWNHATDMWEVDLIAAGPWEFSLPIKRSEFTRITHYEIIENEIVIYGLQSLSITPNRYIINYGSWTSFSYLDRVIFENEQVSLDLSDLWFDWTMIDAVVTVAWEVVDEFGITLEMIGHDQEHYTQTAGWGMVHFENDGLERNQLIITPIAYEWEVIIEEGKLAAGSLLKRTVLEAIVIDLP